MDDSIRIFSEFHSGKRWPCVSYRLNGQPVSPSTETQQQVDDHTQHRITEFKVKFDRKNLLEVIQSDKTDHDLLATKDGYVDHYVKICDVEIDGIMMEGVLYKDICDFRHSMPVSWVESMKDKGILIAESYPNSTELRLNGVWSIAFETPVWQWHVNKL